MDHRDVEGFLHELQGVHDAFRACFARSEPREHFFRYMVGQFSALERKSIEPIALRVDGGNVRAMQRCLSEVAWDEAQMLRTYHRLVDEDIGDPEGVLICDESSFPKKGHDSVGVARQYGGALGKVDNCQVGVFAAYASRHGYALVDTPLFLPEPWLTDAYARRRTQGQVPDDRGFQTKPQLAAAMLRELRDAGVLPFKYVVADGLYGHSPEFLQAIEACPGMIYFVSIPSDTRCWLQGPVLAAKHYKYKGEVRSTRVVAQQEKAPMTIEAVAQSLHDGFWYRRNVSAGTKGPMVYECTKRQVTRCNDGQPDKTVWLVMKRTIGEPPSYGYYISNAPVSTRLPLFVWLSGMRWAIEQCFAETKTELGMDQYEIRKSRGWHHHILTCMLAHFFLWHVQIRLGKKAPALTVSQLRVLLEVILPVKTYTVYDALQLVEWVQQRNYRADLSHRKAREEKSVQGHHNQVAL
jgi:SRSO17 transposase